MGKPCVRDLTGVLEGCQFTGPLKPRGFAHGGLAITALYNPTLARVHYHPSNPPNGPVAF